MTSISRSPPAAMSIMSSPGFTYEPEDKRTNHSRVYPTCERIRPLEDVQGGGLQGFVLLDWRGMSLFQCSAAGVQTSSKTIIDFHRVIISCNHMIGLYTSGIYIELLNCCLCTRYMSLGFVYVSQRHLNILLDSWAVWAQGGKYSQRSDEVLDLLFLKGTQRKTQTTSISVAAVKGKVKVSSSEYLAVNKGGGKTCSF